MKWLFRLFTAAYVVALGIATVGALGYFGQSPEATSDVLLRPLGMPWNLLIDEQSTYVFVMMLLAPAVNLGILWLAADLIESREE